MDMELWQSTLYTLEDGLPDSYVYSIIVDKNEHVWFGTGEGLALLIE